MFPIAYGPLEATILPTEPLPLQHMDDHSAVRK